MRTVYDLMAAAVQHLTGQKVWLRMKKPEGKDGLAWRDEAGIARIDIRPDLPDDLMLYVLLHEAAHIKSDKFISSPEAVVRKASFSTSGSQMVREDRADTQAKAWMEYGEKHRDKSLDWYEGVLRALLIYPEEG